MRCDTDAGILYLRRMTFKEEGSALIDDTRNYRFQILDGRGRNMAYFAGTPTFICRCYALQRKTICSQNDHKTKLKIVSC